MLKTIHITLLDYSKDVTNTFNAMIKARYNNGNKGLRYTNLFTHYGKMEVGQIEIPFAYQINDNVNIEIYLN